MAKVIDETYRPILFSKSRISYLLEPRYESLELVALLLPQLSLSFHHKVSELHGHQRAQWPVPSAEQGLWSCWQPLRRIWRQHQRISSTSPGDQSNADQFIMISNVAGFCCQIINFILIIYCTIFFTKETVREGAMSAVMYHVSWLATTIFGLTLKESSSIMR